MSPDSDDTDTEGERGREQGVGAVGGHVPVPYKARPPAVVEAVPSLTTSVTSRQALSPSSPVTVLTSRPDPLELQVPTGSALQRLARNLHRLAQNLTRVNQNQQNQTWTNHSPLRQLETGRGGGEADDQPGSRDDEEDVELLIPMSDSDDSSSMVSNVRQQLLEPHPSSTAGHTPRDHHGNGPCEHCGIVHTAQIPDACLESKTESSDDELLLLC